MTPLRLGADQGKRTRYLPWRSGSYDNLYLFRRSSGVPEGASARVGLLARQRAGRRRGRRGCGAAPVADQRRYTLQLVDTARRRVTRRIEKCGYVATRVVSRYWASSMKNMQHIVQ